MPLVRRQLRQAAWVALFALLGLSFAPWLARASLAGDICSSTHTSRDVPQHDTGAMLQHCPLCAHHAAGVALPGPSIATLQPPAGSAWQPRVVVPIAPPHAAWLAPAPRGPPVAG